MKYIKLGNRIIIFSQPAPPSADITKEILNGILSPVLDDIGLNHWDGNYTWYSDFNEEGIKKVFQYVKLKGYKATFTYGLCFNFIPSVSNHKKLIHHRTNGTTKLQLFERTKGWSDSFQGKKLNDTISHWSEKDLKKDLKKLIKKYKPIVQNWFQNNQSISSSRKTAEQQSLSMDYSINSPSPLYVLGFLQIKSGYINAGKKTIESYFFDLAKSDDSYEEDYKILSKYLDSIS